jgi:hypothetical protein
MPATNHDRAGASSAKHFAVDSASPLATWFVHGLRCMHFSAEGIQAAIAPLSVGLAASLLTVERMSALRLPERGDTVSQRY